MDILIRILIWLLMMVFTPLSSISIQEPPIIDTWPAPLPEEETVRSLTVIESVDALLMESFPVQINLNVTGFQPDGCDFPVVVDQRREGNEVFVDIYREMPLAVMCPAVLRSYEATIHLDGGFEPGMYTIHVNDQVIEVTI